MNYVRRRRLPNSGFSLCFANLCCFRNFLFDLQNLDVSCCPDKAYGVYCWIKGQNASRTRSCVWHGNICSCILLILLSNNSTSPKAPRFCFQQLSVKFQGECVTVQEILVKNSYVPRVSLSALVGSVKDLVPFTLTAAIRYWYHLPGPTSRTTREVSVVCKRIQCLVRVREKLFLKWLDKTDVSRLQSFTHVCSWDQVYDFKTDSFRQWMISQLQVCINIKSTKESYSATKNGLFFDRVSRWHLPYFHTSDFLRKRTHNKRRNFRTQSLESSAG